MTVINITHKMASKTSRHGYGTKLRHCRPMYNTTARNTNRHLLAVPRFRLNTYVRRAFSVAGPMAWNSLPDFIRDPTSSTDCLGVHLKRTCSRVTNAFGALNDNARYESMQSCQSFSTTSNL